VHSAYQTSVFQTTVIKNKKIKPKFMSKCLVKWSSKIDLRIELQVHIDFYDPKHEPYPPLLG